MTATGVPRELQIPRLWLLACLAFWGALTDHTLSALICGGLLELANVVAFRLALSARHYERLADLTTVAFAVLVVYAFTTYGVLGIYAILTALPWMLIPLAFAQVYGTGHRTPLSALVMSLRRHIEEPPRTVDLRPILGCACLLAASTTPAPPTWYAGGVGGLLFALMFVNRNRRYPVTRWAGTAALALVCGVFTYLGVVRGQLLASGVMQAVIVEFGFVPADPGQTYTALGTLGRLKLSDRIRLRVDAPLDTPLPIRLTEARYQRFDNGLWRNRDQALVPVDATPGASEWILAPGTRSRRRMGITAERTREIGALALPPGTGVLRGADLLEIRRHSLGTVVAEARPGFLHYTLEYSLAESSRAPPSADDLSVPPSYRPLFARIAQEAGMPGLPPAEAVRRAEKFFHEKFRYSLVQPGYFPGRQPLAAFLQRQRAGHCEYFATATTLLLRLSGVPTRYAVGYMADEYSARERLFLVRARHAHAWVEAFVEGAWRVVDTTPALWLEAETPRGFPWHWFGDSLNWLRWQIQRFQRGEMAVDPRLALVVPVLAAWLFWRLRPLARRRIRHDQRAPVARQAAPTAATPLLELLLRQGLQPAPGETTRDFVFRCRPWRAAETAARVVSLHYAERFRPGGLTPMERAECAAAVELLSREIVEDGRARRAAP